jgi:hypothetical protein
VVLKPVRASTDRVLVTWNDPWYFSHSDVIDEVGQLPISTLSVGKARKIVWVVIKITRVIDHVCHVQGNVGTVSRGDEIVGTAAGGIRQCVHTDTRQLKAIETKPNEENEKKSRR